MPPLIENKTDVPRANGDDAGRFVVLQGGGEGEDYGDVEDRPEPPKAS